MKIVICDDNITCRNQIENICKDYETLADVSFEYVMFESGEEYGNMKSWQEKLEDCNIIRVHKSYMVNLKNIESWGEKICIRGRKEQIPVGIHYILGI